MANLLPSYLSNRGRGYFSMTLFSLLFSFLYHTNKPVIFCPTTKTSHPLPPPVLANCPKEQFRLCRNSGQTKYSALFHQLFTLYRVTISFSNVFSVSRCSCDGLHRIWLPHDLSQKVGLAIRTLTIAPNGLMIVSII